MDLARVAVEAGRFDARGLSNIAWAFAILECFDEPLMTALALSSRPRLHLFSAQGLSTTAWSFSKLSIVDDPLLDSIAARSMPTMDSFHA